MSVNMKINDTSRMVFMSHQEKWRAAGVSTPRVQAALRHRLQSAVLARGPEVRPHL